MVMPGVVCYDRNLEWASSVARLLGTLCKSSVWCPAVHTHIAAAIDTLRKVSWKSVCRVHEGVWSKEDFGGWGVGTGSQKFVVKLDYIAFLSQSNA